MPARRRDLLDLVPDEPRWIEARAMLLAGAEVTAAGAGFLVIDPALSLAVAIGNADADAVAHAAVETVLFAVERDDLHAALTARGWHLERAVLHTLPDPDALPDDEGTGPLAPDADLSRLPPPLAAEIAHALRTRTVHTVLVDGAPAAFAYAPWRTERWFDVSVDTVPGARQLGLGARVAAAMIRAERAEGREPVWGAAVGNAASLRLAARLGFAAVDAIVVARR